MKYDYSPIKPSIHISYSYMLYPYKTLLFGLEMHHTSTVLKLFALDVLKKTNKQKHPPPPTPKNNNNNKKTTHNIDGPEPVHVEL